METIEYSVCEDCLITVAHVCNDSTSAVEGDHVERRMKDELDGRQGHFVAGVSPTEDDPDGNGYEEFSRAQCELCMDYRGGSRHGITLLIQEDK